MESKDRILVTKVLGTKKKSRKPKAKASDREPNANDSEKNQETDRNVKTDRNMLSTAGDEPMRVADMEAQRQGEFRTKSTTRCSPFVYMLGAGILSAAGFGVGFYVSQLK